MTAPKVSDFLVSVVIPTYNVEAHIVETLNSVLSQTHKNIEVIVVDDASTDSTVEILLEMSRKDSRVEVLQLPNNSGMPSVPRNAGVDLARGKYIAFLDGDDIWMSNKLQFQLSAMNEYNLNFSCTCVSKFNGKSAANHSQESKDILNAERVELIEHDQLLKKNIIATSSVIVDSSIIGRHRFNVSSSYCAIEDFEFWLRLHQNKNISSGFIDVVSVYYRVRSDSLSRSKLIMAKRIFYLLLHYKFDGKSLGLMRLYYFITYIKGSFESKMYR